MSSINMSLALGQFRLELGLWASVTRISVSAPTPSRSVPKTRKPRKAVPAFSFTATTADAIALLPLDALSAIAPPAS